MFSFQHPGGVEVLGEYLGYDVTSGALVTAAPP